MKKEKSRKNSTERILIEPFFFKSEASKKRFLEDSQAFLEAGRRVWLKNKALKEKERKEKALK